jgi:hypothetical protein
VTKFNFAAFASVVMIQIFSVSAVSAAECSIYGLPLEYSVVSCDKRQKSEVLTLEPIASTSYSTKFDKMPTILVRGDMKDATDGINADHNPAYNNLIVLPEPESIVKIYNAPVSARRKIEQDTWKVIDMKTVVYKGGGGEDEGYVMVCSTLNSQIENNSAFLVQCSEFYDDDIARLKRLLSGISNSSAGRPK